MERTQMIVQGESGLEYRWNGSHTVNIYAEGQEVDVFTSGEDEPTCADIIDSVERRESCLAGEHDTVTDGYCDYCGTEVAVVS